MWITKSDNTRVKLISNPIEMWRIKCFTIQNSRWVSDKKFKRQFYGINMYICESIKYEVAAAKA